MSQKVYTVGHSALSLPHFLGLLRTHAVDTVVDVRSQPHSGRAPHFCRAALTSGLDSNGISYVFAGAALGGRPKDQRYYSNGRVQYERMAESKEFLRAIRKLRGAARTRTLALMCAEADPLDCHRFLLVSRCLSQTGTAVEHILPTGVLESQAELETRLLRNLGLLQADMFAADLDAVARAYRAQAERVAFAQYTA